MQASNKISFEEVSILFKLAVPLVITGFIEASVGFFFDFIFSALA